MWWILYTAIIIFPLHTPPPPFFFPRHLFPYLLKAHYLLESIHLTIMKCSSTFVSLPKNFRTLIICSFIYIYIFMAGEESSKWFAPWYSIGIVDMLHFVYACIYRYCWFSTILWFGSGHTYLLSICKLWGAMGSVSMLFACNLWSPTFWKFEGITFYTLGVKLHCSYFRYIITAGAVTALCSSLLGSLLPQVS